MLTIESDFADATFSVSLQEKYLVDIIKTEDVVTAMRFGRFGREDGALVMVTASMFSIYYMLRTFFVSIP